MGGQTGVEGALAGGGGAGAPVGGPAWTDCGDGFECATLRVPMAAGQPGKQVELAVIRLPAGGGPRIGSLVVNPGGPGISGVEYVRAARVVLGEKVRERFDIVGFDPRGVGRSAPVECLSDAELDTYLMSDGTPDSARERSALEGAARRFAEGCRRHSGGLLPHLGTADAARDLDLLRQALGERRLTYLGKSYGTLLGAVYAELYPGRVRAMVLDGAMDPGASRLRLSVEHAVGFERALRAYAGECVAMAGCPFRSRTVNGALEEVSGLLRRTDKRPLRGDGRREVTQAVAVLGLLGPLHDRALWPELTEALRRAFKGDGALLLRNADQLTGRRDDGTYSGETAANLAVTCVDGAYPRTAAAYGRSAAVARERAPRFGASMVWASLPCAYWPHPPTLAAGPLTAKGAAPILVVGTVRDPATPYAWARRLAGRLESGVLLTYEGDGHTAYASGSRCVDEAVEEYLVAGVVPEDGAVCPGIG
ncbi:alpha/beta hydrolase [Nonomuraea gerenzanensis]|uniref:Probable exported protease n=1 Tax=Nonomuraea gerenzanensis TaxID=93944 RepID=A0A1M4DWL3_9ACTN|nr:alpha/beta hydrolase [Nonomuraea gerenzanensis]UBU13303.1 alpha/beta hydrolase [Nonomuraea gerenzanensis]SBO90956.1 probable exported protease [Nonomuraea gerenzanensis]